ncbi:MAG: hypothetical protein C5B49_04100 [Bdellovibrio sp.]|nr:MAG: hypothetical protein C5B49_04100 [Bdellovibrio sp.]
MKSISDFETASMSPSAENDTASTAGASALGGGASSIPTSSQPNPQGSPPATSTPQSASASSLTSTPSASASPAATPNSSSMTSVVDIGYELAGKNLVPDCATDSNFNSCLFWKNPVAQTGAILSGHGLTTSTDLSSVQIDAVNIPSGWYDNSGYLQNPTIKVYLDQTSNTAARVTTAAGNFKFAYANDANRKVTQTMVFYWLMTEVNFFKERVGKFYAENHGVVVFASDSTLQNNAYFSLTDHTLHAGRDDQGVDLAVGAEIVLHEMGHANAFFSSNGGIHIASGGQTADGYCTTARAGSLCCRDKFGCASGIDEGQADHHAGLVFISDPALGQTWFNNLNGVVDCGIARNAVKNLNLTADEVYLSCGNSGAGSNFNGEIHIMGALYASIWYALAATARATGGADAVDIDKLFSEHLKVLTGADNFPSVYAKLRAIDSSLFGGKFGTAIQAEFKKRNLI